MPAAFEEFGDLSSGVAACSAHEKFNNVAVSTCMAIIGYSCKDMSSLKSGPNKMFWPNAQALQGARASTSLNICRPPLQKSQSWKRARDGKRRTSVRQCEAFEHGREGDLIRSPRPDPGCTAVHVASTPQTGVDGAFARMCVRLD